MKTKYMLQVLLAVVIAVSSSCKEPGCTDPNAVNYNSHANTDDCSCQFKGTVTFWSRTTGISVMVYDGNSSTGTITTAYTAAPASGASGCFTLTLPPTTGVPYDYDIFVNSNYTGSGSVTVPSAGKVVVEVQ